MRSARIAAQPIPNRCVPLQSPLGGRVQWDESGFAEFGVPNRQYAVDEVHIVPNKTQCLIGPQSSGNI